MLRKKTDKEIQELKDLKEKHGTLKSKGYFQPEWRESGGKNAELQNDIEGQNTLDEKYWVPKVDDMDWLAIRKQSKCKV